jgi:octaprenyl-diphosphate synthase
MEHGTREQAAAIRHAVEQGGIEELSAVLDAVRRTGALDYAREQARAESRAACEALAGLPNTKYRDYLIQLADFAVTRKF